MTNQQAVGLQSSRQEEMVSLSHLAELIGVPLDYIKQELTLDPETNDTLSMDELRGRVLKYLATAVQGA